MSNNVAAAADRCRDALSCTWLDLDNLSAGFAGDLLTLARAYLALVADRPRDAAPAAGGRRVRYTGSRWDVEEYRAGERHPYLIGWCETEADARLLCSGPAALRAAAEALEMCRRLVPKDTVFADNTSVVGMIDAVLARLRAGGGGS